MKKTWYVIDPDDNSVSWSAKRGSAESFGNKLAAVRRAKAMASMNPDCVFLVCESIGAFVAKAAPVSSVALK